MRIQTQGHQLLCEEAGGLDSAAPTKASYLSFKLERNLLDDQGVVLSIFVHLWASKEYIYPVYIYKYIQSLSISGSSTNLVERQFNRLPSVRVLTISVLCLGAGEMEGIHIGEMATSTWSWRLLLKAVWWSWPMDLRNGGSHCLMLQKCLVLWKYLWAN